jgi:predicted exporter
VFHPSQAKNHHPSEPSRQDRKSKTWTLLATLWLLVVLAVGYHQFLFWKKAPLSTDVLALLPANEQAPEVAQANRQLNQGAAGQIIIMLGTPNWEATQQAAAAWRAHMQTSQAPLVPSAGLDAMALQSAINFYQPWRNRLLNPAQRQQLENTSVQALTKLALSELYQPKPGVKLTTWAADPLGLWPQWWAHRASDTQARPRDGELWLSAEGRQWLVLPYTITGSAFALSATATYASALDAAQKAAAQVSPDLVVLRAGIPLHSEAAAVQANAEINTIGWGSLAAVLLLVWLAFRAWRPIVLVATSLLIGCATALSVTAWVFDQVHLITLVFGASLIGVAEDYGIHYFASRQGHPHVAPRRLMRQLLPGLSLALLTSVMAYVVLGAAPFPGLRQMAVFSSVGLVGAFLTAVCWFPLLHTTPIAPNTFSNALCRSLKNWTKFNTRPRLIFMTSLFVIISLAGAWQFKTNDDIRQLQNSPIELMQSQRDISRLLGTPSPAQFYLVQGATEQEVLEREEALKTRLDQSITTQHIAGYRAISDWVPSQARQTQDAQLTATSETQVLARINTTLGEKLQRPSFENQNLTLEDWLKNPASHAARDLWLGEVGAQLSSIVMLRGIQSPAVLPQLAAQAEGLPGVRWVNQTAEVSTLLGRYRQAMAWLLVCGHAAVLALLWWRYRKAAWRAWLPTAVASLLTVALLACCGQPFQLFNVLALALLLGIGVDYSIFLTEHPSDPSAWLAVVLGAASTWLSLGLLGLSNTPALRAFGLTLLVGVPLVWALAPVVVMTEVSPQANPNPDPPNAGQTNNYSKLAN